MHCTDIAMTEHAACSALRSGLRQRVMDSPIFDAPRFAQHFETALRGMWREWCKQQEKSS
jgi:predicted O-linked N-acetylglucosamine transferase (SPINDLY family)